MRSLCCTLALLLLTAGLALAQAPRPVILDADTGNEIDDLYALARALVEPSWEVLALNAAQWQASHWAVPETMENSHRLNQVMVGYTGVDVPTLRGGATRMYDWGDQAQHSAAAYEIIRRARALPEGDSLTVVVLGALTNVASAVYIDPSVASKLAVYWLGSTYD
ncbi:MAG: nucleoside hydrolase, partial [Bacteroidota bacterium]